MTDEARIAAFLALVVVGAFGIPLIIWYVRMTMETRDAAKDAKAALEGVEGGRGLVAQVETLRVKSHDHANDILGLQLTHADHEKRLTHLEERRPTRRGDK